MTKESRDIAGVIAPPPLIYAGALLLGLILHALRPIRLVRFWSLGMRAVLSGSLFGLAFTMTALAISAMRRAQTNVNPFQPSTALVVEGPFKLTRNPLYLSFTLLYISISLLVNTVWTLLLLPAVLIAMRRGVIEREERYLERRFGEQYLRYKGQVPRWM